MSKLDAHEAIDIQTYHLRSWNDVTTKVDIFKNKDGFQIDLNLYHDPEFLSPEPLYRIRVSNIKESFRKYYQSTLDFAGQRCKFYFATLDLIQIEMITAMEGIVGEHVNIAYYYIKDLMKEIGKEIKNLYYALKEEDFAIKETDNE